ncbi:TonB-dependent receptor plug domain-containing protein [Opitutus terrae]|uniref:TonB-dependent receptor plug n=1 Tax=Opitutus terrae (strain DSM 11246 / JCM 15787 / PB90-1) TaxID=452637 RepID=B1ZY33_OPITP|nr:TonB-dependent receptor plug domain-containing protein [Opitutus terrae]ACB76182.1 TonB-dependent receptor plug [Opitutus terrae PB90-1]
MKTNLKPWLAASSFLIVAGGLFAQSAPAALPQSPALSAEENDDTIILSPFTVTGESDIGYQATSTLAGTRLRTELRDVGSSISIVNQELLQDTGSANLEDVLIFTPNTEVGGLGGNFTASQSSGNPIPEQQRDSHGGGITRIRGLAAADLTRDYFITDIPFDTYNTDRVEVQRGANSALFGLGSPGGIVNSATIKADFLSNRGRIRAETDSYGTQRYSLRYNHVLNKYVALHVAALNEDTRYEQRQAFSKDKRYFVAAAVKLPFNLTARGSFESADRAASRPDYIPPNDGITPWINMGKPVFNSPAEAGAFFRGTGAFVPGVANSTFLTLAGSGTGAGMAAFYGDPSNPNPTFMGTPYVRGNRGIPSAGGLGEWMMLQPFTETQIIRRSGYRSDGTLVPAGTATFYSNGYVGTQITDRSIYDYRKNLFSGGSSQEFSDWVVYTASLDGTWFENRLGMELSYYNQAMNTSGYNSLQGSEQRTIYIDPNRYLINTADATGTGALVANPSFGQPVMGGLWTGNLSASDRESKRATGFVELRATDMLKKGWLSKLLGKLTLTGLIEESVAGGEGHYSRDQLDLRSLASAFSGGVINGAGINQADARIASVYTLPVANSKNFLAANSINDLAGAGIGGVTYGPNRDRAQGGSFVGWDSVSKSFKTVTSPAYGLRDNGGFPSSFSSSKSITEIDSQVVVAQHYLWDKAVILTGTWRKDKQSSGAIGAPQNYAGVPGVENIFDPVYVAGVPRPLKVDAEEETKSWSIVVHTPDFLQKYLPAGWDFSAYKSKADNFRPSGGRVNIYNEQIAPLTGATEEMGFMVSALDGKLQGRFNWYETGVLNNSFDKGGVSNSEGILLSLARELDNPANVAQGFKASDVQAYLPPQGVIDMNGFQPDWANAQATTNRNSNDNGTQDFTSEGLEFEIAYNPTPHWTILMNVAKQKTVTSNTYPVMQRYINEFVLPKWVNSDFAKKYVVNEITGQTLAQVAQTTIVDPVLQAVTEDGNPAKEERQWRWNLNTSYNFGRHSSIIPKYFGNLTVGGGVRWEDRMGIGFGVAKNALGNMSFDRSQAFYAPSQTFADVFIRMDYALPQKRNFVVQVNVKDLTDHDELVPFYANPDGGRFYRILEGRLFVLSATLEF